MNTFLDFIKNNEKFKAAQSLNSLKVTVSDVEHKDYNTDIQSPDLRYFLEGDKLVGLHISDAEFKEGDWQVIEKGISEVTDLQVLYLSGTPLRTLILNDVKYLNFINISFNKYIKGVRLNGLLNLIEFWASHCGRLSSIELRGEQKTLEKVDISNGQIQNLSMSKSLDKLSYLNCSNNQLTVLNLGKTPSLKFALLSNNSLESLTFLKSKNLSIVDLSKNRKLGFIPAAIFLAKNSLESLKLSNTAITLKSIKPIRDFTILSQVELQNTPIDKEYPADVKQGWEAVKRLLIDKLVAFNHAKVLLLGNTNVGKSDLIHYLKTNKQRQESPSTHGLEYHQLVYPKGTRIEENKIYLHCWDFGGQNYYHGTHKLFFSGGSINLLLWSRKYEYRFDEEEQCFELDYWLRCIEQLSFNTATELKTKTLVIENKIDWNEPAYSSTPINEIDYQNRYGQNMDLDYVSMALKPERKIDSTPYRFEIFEAYFHSIVKQSIQERPMADKMIFDKIKELAKISPAVKVGDILQHEGAETTVLEVFHLMGIILYFKEISPDIVFIRPHDFLTFLYNDILKSRKKYSITDDEIKVILNTGPFQNLLEYDQVLQLLLYFDLIFKIDAESSKFFIPQYLPEGSDVNLMTSAYFNSFPSVSIESDSYLMNLVMLKVFSRFGNFVSKSGENYQFWKDGLVIGEHGKYELKIVFHREKQQVEIFENKDATNIDFLKIVVGYILSLTTRFDFDIQITNASNQQEQATETIIEESKPMLLFSWESDYFQTYLSIEVDRKVAYRSLKEAHELKNRYCKCIEGNSIDITPFEKFFKVTNTMSSKTHNQGVNYNQLLQKFKNQSVVVFIGSGVSAYTTKGAKLATWRGLLEDGINYCMEVANCNQEWKDLRMKQLNTNDLDEWLSVAEIITSKLKKYKYFKTWLRNSVGQLPSTKPELIQKIGELNTQIYTTNYDNLLKQNLNRGVISNRNVDKIQEVLSGSRNAIVHLHGFYDDPETVVLGNISYNDLSHEAFFQAIQQSIFNSKHILFVGFGSGLEDPNFGSLLEWTKNFTTSEHHHYRLVLENEKEKLAVDSKIQNLVYGASYDDLLPFFENLVNDVNNP